MRPRILFVSHSADWIGPTNSLLLLLQRLRAHYEVAVLLRGRGRFSEKLEQEGIRFFSQGALDKWSILETVKLIRGEGFNLVYANEAHGGSRNAFIAARIAGVPFVGHVRSMGWNKSWIKLGYLRWAEAVVAVSQACASSIQRFVRPERLHVVHNGVSLNGVCGEGTAERSAVLQELGIEPTAFVLLSASHLCPRKAQEHAIRAIAPVLESVPTAHLLLVGSPDRDRGYVEKLHVLARTLGVEHHVHIVGFRADLPRLLAAADVFVHTATSDPHPRAVIEAMAARLPVVAFAVDGVAETVVDGDTGRLVSACDYAALADAVVEIATSPERRKRMGTAGRLRVKRYFSSTVTADEINRVVQDVLNISPS